MEKIRALIIANFLWRGRLNRSGLYISIGLFYAFGLLALPFQIVLAVATSLEAAWLAVGLNGLLLIFGVAMAWNLLGAVVRRLHDRSKSGLWLLLFFGPHAAVVALVSRIPFSEQKMITLAMILGMVVAAPFLVWGMVEIFCLRGREETNHYGPDPLATMAGEPAASLP
ncbi:DUF805 domain-containing protein [Brevundimonas sp. NPDC090276]|uniref:DUF805 domain-containing protein n=1 Tax=Brevundimonas sp. NPDC090276 TaxID=3363956 RepID=UPI00383AF9DD